MSIDTPGLSRQLTYPHNGYTSSFAGYGFDGSNIGLYIYTVEDNTESKQVSI